MSDDIPELGPITRRNGVGDQFSYEVTVTYPGEEPMHMAFVGHTAGGPIVMVNGPRQTFVSEPERFGVFGKEWVRRFFLDRN